MPFSELENISLRHQQAEFATDQAKNQEGLFLCEDYACDYLLRTFRSIDLTSSLLHPAMEILERYDRENHTELKATLSCYLYHESNQLLASRDLHIHTNTMRYRLQRICEITGLTLTDPKELQYLRLSYWLR